MSSLDLTSLLPAALRSSYIHTPPPTRDSTVVVDERTQEDEEREEGEGKQTFASIQGGAGPSRNKTCTRRYTPVHNCRGFHIPHLTSSPLGWGL